MKAGIYWESVVATLSAESLACLIKSRTYFPFPLLSAIQYLFLERLGNIYSLKITISQVLRNTTAKEKTANVPPYIQPLEYVV